MHSFVTFPCYAVVVKIGNAQLLRVSQAPAHAPVQAQTDPVDQFQPHVDSDLPDLSGFARQNGRFLAVTDAKAESPQVRLGWVDPQNGSFRGLGSEWGDHRPARDLEAVTAVQGQPGRFLAVEGSSWEGQSNRLFQLSVDDTGSQVERAYELPPLPQEIEGLVELPLQQPHRRLVILGGRGGEQGEPGKLYWGVLDQHQGSLTFSAPGLEGTEVQAPQLGTGLQRHISELELQPDGSLWASTTADEGDYGPFESAVYRVGQIQADEIQPLHARTNEPEAARISGTKVEGFATHERGWITGADNEKLGGEVGFLLR